MKGKRELRIHDGAVGAKMKPLFPVTGAFGWPCCPDRDVLEGILWMLEIGTRWREIPGYLPSPTTSGAAERLGGGRDMGQPVARSITSSNSTGKGCSTGRSASRQRRAGQKRRLCGRKTKKGKGTKWMVADGQGLSVGGTLASTSPAGVKLAIDALTDCRGRTGRFAIE